MDRSNGESYPIQFTQCISWSLALTLAVHKYHMVLINEITKSFKALKEDSGYSNRLLTVCQKLSVFNRFDYLLCSIQFYSSDPSTITGDL